MSSTDDEDFKYDVFLSFRGEDTRNNFTTHLYAALLKKQIKVFIDYKLQKGDEISPSLLTAIEESRISIVVFSKEYASSKWCLQELEKILECRGREKYSQIVIPVFHGINPSDVRKQTGTFRDAFAKHEQAFADKPEKLQRWRTALTQAANLSGWDSSVIRIEHVLVNKIVKDVLRKLGYFSTITEGRLVGIESKVNLIESSLCAQSNDVRALGIWGIGGIGKTTLAEAVFNKIACQFEGSCFVSSVRERLEKHGGLNHLRKKLFYQILGDRNGNTAALNRLGRKKLLIVFDDVSDFGQIEFLIGGFDCLNPRSRIIVTTRDRSVLRNSRVDQIYHVNELFHDEALKLFSSYAFHQNHPPVDYMELSKEFVSHTRGVPLALIVLGPTLLGRTKEVWKAALDKITRIIDHKTYDVLKISYDVLDDMEKNIFLDIACFFVGEDKDLVETFMHATELYTDGLRVLMDKSLLTVSKNNHVLV